MPKTQVRQFCFDGDVLEVVFRYDDISGMHFGDYPDFEETPRHTPGGHPWVNAIQDACQHGVNQYDSAYQCLDCGSCWFYLKEHPGDLIGICQNELKRINRFNIHAVHSERMMSNETEDQTQT